MTWTADRRVLPGLLAKVAQQYAGKSGSIGFEVAVKVPSFGVTYRDKGNLGIALDDLRRASNANIILAAETALNGSIATIEGLFLRDHPEASANIPYIAGVLMTGNAN